jgi:hypothetical protein
MRIMLSRFHGHRSYRFYFMTRQGSVAGSSDAHCAGDEQACSLAIEMFGEQGINRSIEVWDSARLVFRYP